MNDDINYENKIKQHILRVQNIILKIIQDLNKRAVLHDLSKLENPEKDIFKKIKFNDVSYGSEEYYDRLKLLKKATDHHYKNNKHHPEYYKNGVMDMTLIDIVEMFADWISAAETYNTEINIYNSLEISKKRFNIDDMLIQIFKNTYMLLKE